MCQGLFVLKGREKLSGFGSVWDWVRVLYENSRVVRVKMADGSSVSGLGFFIEVSVAVRRFEWVNEGCQWLVRCSVGRVARVLVSRVVAKWVRGVGGCR